MTADYGSTLEQAESNVRACETCLDVYDRSRTDEVPDVPAWRAYQECFREARQ